MNGRRVGAAVSLVLMLGLASTTPASCGSTPPATPAPIAASSPVPVPTPVAPSSSAPASATPAEAVLLAAGDIASCSSSGDEATARLLDELPGTVATLGDAAYPNGSAANFRACYGPGWGRHSARTRPAPGNHEYESARAAPYFAYFGTLAGDPSKGYYSYELGAWHVVVVNSNCAEVGGCGTGSAQERWVRADLAASGARCTLAYWHHPLFTSGANHPPAVEMRPIFTALYEAGAEVVLAGHNHQYERFAPLAPDGQLDPGRGIRSFVVGTGGASHYAFGRVRPNSEARDATTFGVLRLVLRADGYDWRFVPVPGGRFTDAGSGSCH